MRQSNLLHTHTQDKIRLPWERGLVCSYKKASHSKLKPESPREGNTNSKDALNGR